MAAIAVGCDLLEDIDETSSEEVTRTGSGRERHEARSSIYQSSGCFEVRQVSRRLALGRRNIVAGLPDYVGAMALPMALPRPCCETYLAMHNGGWTKRLFLVMDSAEWHGRFVQLDVLWLDAES